ncbi:MAG: hypothetical protein WAW88_15365 [Nocardioides sp.]
MQETSEIDVTSRGALAVLAAWPVRRWVTAAGAALAVALLVGLPTDLIPNPVFGRTIPPTTWSYPVLAVTALLSGLLIATYVRAPLAEVSAPEGADQRDPTSTRGLLGGALSFFAVGCPVCNKLVLLALGTTGAVRWFEPVQPLLAAASIALVAYALRERLLAEVACRLPAS